MNRMRITRSKRNSRRSHHGVTFPAHSVEGGVLRLRHRASRISGVYRGRKIVSGTTENSSPSAKTDDEKRTEEQVPVSQ